MRTFSQYKISPRKKHRLKFKMKRQVKPHLMIRHFLLLYQVFLDKLLITILQLITRLRIIPKNNQSASDGFESNQSPSEDSENNQSPLDDSENNQSSSDDNMWRQKYLELMASTGEDIVNPVASPTFSQSPALQNSPENIPAVASLPSSSDRENIWTAEYINAAINSEEELLENEAEEQFRQQYENLLVVPVDFEDPFNCKSYWEYHCICPKCSSYVSEFDETDKFKSCTTCDHVIPLKSSAYRDFFVIFNTTNCLRSILEENADYFNSVMNNIRNPSAETSLSDITDGLMYKKFCKDITDDFATFIFNCDGAPVFKSSTFSIWPI